MNLASIVESHPAEEIALVSGGRVTTYGELRELVARARGGLRSLGLDDGDRLALVCGNGRDFVVLYLAALGLGVVTVPLNPSSPAPELVREVQVVAARVVVAEPGTAWADVDRGAVPTVQHVVSTEPPMAGAAAFTHDLLVDDLFAASPVDMVDVASSHLAVMMFTSGTAGAPRAAMLSHGNLLANIEQAQATGADVLSTDVVYGVLPLHHIFGLNVVLGLSLARGASVVLVRRFDPSTALDTIRERGVTVVPGAPPMWLAFSHFDDLPADSFGTVRLALSGAARMPHEATRRLLDRFGLVLHEGYGLTEASPMVSTSAGVEQRIGSVGRVLEGIRVRLVDEEGNDAVAGDAGEVWVKGPNVFVGYHDDPDATARVLTDDGWLRTGDIAVSDDEGNLWLVDRAKDLIIVSGFNVYPAEVEEVLAEHPAVAEAGVVGVPHPHQGEAVKAYVVLRPGATVQEDTLVDWCLDRLARYKCPSKVLFVDALPRNANGKVLRRSLV